MRLSLLHNDMHPPHTVCLQYLQCRKLQKLKGKYVMYKCILMDFIFVHSMLYFSVMSVSQKDSTNLQSACITSLNRCTQTTAVRRNERRRRKTRGRGGYLLAGRGKFIRLGCQVGQVLQDGLQVGHLAQHVDLVVLRWCKPPLVSAAVHRFTFKRTLVSLTRTGFSMLTKLQ